MNTLNTPLVKRAYNLGLKATANFADVLTEPQIEYYEQHLDEIPSAIARGFILPQKGEPVPPPQEKSRFRIEILKETPKPCVNRSADEQIANIQTMYKMLGWELSVTGLIVPERRKGFDRLLVIGNKLTDNSVFEACESSFPSWRYSNDLDATITKSERHPKVNGTYAVWFRDTQEADKELKNLSAADIEVMKPMPKTITSLERGVFELVYSMETGLHLDVSNITLCSGSRDSDGDVPYAYWRDGRFEVNYFHPCRRNPSLRSREAVSL